MGQSSQGTVITIAAEAIGEVTTIGGPNAAKPEIETSHLTSAAAEFVGGLIDYGQTVLTMNFTDPENQGQADLRTNFEDAASPSVAFVINFAGGSGARSVTWQGWVQEMSTSIETNDRITQDITIRNTGAATWGVQP